MMTHKACGGRVFIDRAFSNEKHFELICLRCGSDWMLTSLDNPFARMLTRSEYGLKVKANGGER